MALITIERMIKDDLEKSRLIAILKQIANSSDFTLYYQSQYSLKELQDKLKEINKLSNIS
jgi:hypothetical protein